MEQIMDNIMLYSVVAGFFSSLIFFLIFIIRFVKEKANIRHSTFTLNLLAVYSLFAFIGIGLIIEEVNSSFSDMSLFWIGVTLVGIFVILLIIQISMHIREIKEAKIKEYDKVSKEWYK